MGAEPSAEALVGEIPFFDTGDEDATKIGIDLAPEGQPSFVLWLDTGASISVVTPRLARRMGVSVRRHKRGAYRKKTRLGRDLHFIIDTSSTDTAADKGWEYGLLGADFLDDYVVEIDYAGRTVRFYDPDHFEIPKTVDAEDESVLPFERSGTRIIVDYELDGVAAKALFDTGAEMTVVSKEVVERSGLDYEALPQGPSVLTTMGRVSSRYLLTDGFVLGDFHFEQAGFIVPPRGLYNLMGGTESALGHDVLRRFVVRIDYEERRIWLKRNQPPEESLVALPAWHRTDDTP